MRVSLTINELFLVSFLTRIVTRGKRGRPVPVFTSEMATSIDILISSREVGLDKRSSYIFSNPLSKASEPVVSYPPPPRTGWPGRRWVVPSARSRSGVAGGGGRPGWRPLAGRQTERGQRNGRSGRGTCSYSEDCFFLFWFVLCWCWCNTLQNHFVGVTASKKDVQLCGTAHPEYFNGVTKTRCNPVSNIMLKGQQHNMLAKFTGNDIRVHREFYRLPEQTLQVAKMGQLLMGLNKDITAYAGKTCRHR